MENNTQTGITELVFIIDKSASMKGIEKDIIRGFNSMIEKQKKEPGTVYVSTILFNETISIIHPRLPLNDVPAMTENDYNVRGSTALLDTIGFALKQTNNLHKNLDMNIVPDDTVFIIITDAMINTSQTYNFSKIRKMIKKRIKKDGWEFLLFGFGEDIVPQALSLGISPFCALQYHIPRTDNPPVCANSIAELFDDGRFDVYKVAEKMFIDIDNIITTVRNNDSLGKSSIASGKTIEVNVEKEKGTIDFISLLNQQNNDEYSELERMFK